ncbi:MAG: hypothetical protein ONB17_11500 [candidate division KSB1 bacterium]|nr:hypothetical protein [candidate division KSB1 bacterium]
MTYVLPELKAVAIAGLGTIILGGLMLLGVLRGRQNPLSYMIGGAVCIATGLWVYYLRSPGRVLLGDGKLVLKVPMYRERVLTGADVERAWVEELTAANPWRPVKKKSGTATRTVRSGRFVLANGRRAFVASEGNRVLCIEAKRGELYQVGIPEFERFVQLFSQEVHLIEPEPAPLHQEAAPKG